MNLLFGLNLNDDGNIEKSKQKNFRNALIYFPMNIIT